MSKEDLIPPDLTPAIAASQSSVTSTPVADHPPPWRPAGRYPLVLMVVVAVSIFSRLAYFVELSDSPLMVEHHDDQSDMCYFDGWARQILAGDWLSRNVTPPLHSWHRTVAEDYFRRHPEELKRLRTNAAGMGQAFFRTHPEARSAVRKAMQPQGEAYYRRNPKELAALEQRIVACGLLWQEWVGAGRFYQEPLYPYLIALTYQVAGFYASYVFAWQILLGLLSNVLIYLIARRYFGEAAGAVAGLLAALCSSLLYFEMVLLRETLVVFTGLLLVWLAGTATRRRSLSWWLATGVVMGLALTLKSHFAIFLLGTLVLLAVQCRKNFRDLLRLEAAALVGIVVGLTPLMARNIAVGVSPLSTASTGGLTFLIANANEPQTPLSNPHLHEAAEIMSQTRGRMLPAVAATLRTYGDGTAYLRLLSAKFTAIWHWFELSDNTNIFYYRLHAAILRYLPVTFFILAPLALMGLLLGIRRPPGPTSAGLAEQAWRAAPHLYLLVLTNLAVLVVFFVRDRFRAPLTAALIPFAALTVVQVVEWLRRGRLAKAAVAMAGVLLLAFWIGRPLPSDVSLIRAFDYTVPYKFYYGPKESQAKQAGDYLQAAEILTDSLRFEPPFVKLLGPAHPADSTTTAALGRFYADVHACCAQDYQLAGKLQEARQERARADELTTAAHYPAR